MSDTKRIVAIAYKTHPTDDRVLTYLGVYTTDELARQACMKHEENTNCPMDTNIFRYTPEWYEESKPEFFRYSTAGYWCHYFVDIYEVKDEVE